MLANLKVAVYFKDIDNEMLLLLQVHLIEGELALSFPLLMQIVTIIEEVQILILVLLNLELLV